MNRHAPLAALWAALVTLSATACSDLVVPTLPGESGYGVRELTFVGNEQLEPGPLLQALAVRPTQFIIPGQPYNPYRQAEDRRRIAAYWTTKGFFDVEVAPADVRFDEAEKVVDITWRLTEGERYEIRRVEVRGAPEGFADDLADAVPFEAGAPVDLAVYRFARHDLATILRRNGWLRAEVVSRAFVDRAAKRVDWYYYADPGPRTVIGRISVHGAHAIPEETILDRAGLTPGAPLDYDMVEKRERDLLDTGAFDTARLYMELDTEFINDAVPPDSWVPPDTGGLVRPEQIAANGDLLPRENVAREVDVDIHVVEAPSVAGELSLGVYADVERVDPFFGARLQLRNAFGPLHHLVFEGNAGYGIRWRGDVEEPLGLYGSAALTYLKPMAFGRLVDLSLSVRFDEEPYPGFHWRTASATLGFRAALDTRVFLHIEPRFRFDWPVGVDSIDPAIRDALHLADLERSDNAEIRLSLVWDERDPQLEPIRGHFLAVRAAYAPGGPLGEHAWIRPELDLRYVINLNADMGIALKTAWSWVADIGGDGVPIGARLFGGGAYGARGFARRRLARYAPACKDDDPTDCQSIPVGASSLMESSVELRWLPYRKQFGAVAFVDLAGAGVDANPVEDGVSVAPGLGLRARLWHFALAFDFSYRVTDLDVFEPLDRFFVFVRVGESF